MRKLSGAPLLVIPIVIVAAFLLGRIVYYGIGAGAAYTPPDRPLIEVPLSAAPRSERLEAVDNPTDSKGVVVVDYSHGNAFFIEELNTLFSRIVARGFSYEVTVDPELVDDDKENQTLVDKLSYAKALILAAPRVEYTPEEIVEVEQFVERGGRVFIVGDPTRTIVVEALNSIAGSFGIIYANDYLYSLEHNDNNYRNVVYTNFADSPITTGLSEDHKVIFYAGGSMSAPGHEIILGDDTTASSTSEGGRTNAAAVLTANDQVLALGDLTFFAEPYSAAENNGVLINNIADFLTSGQPAFEITNFPFFFDTNIDIVFDDPLVFNSQFEDAAKLKDFLEQREHVVNFVDKIGPENDVIFVGRYDNTKSVDDYLQAANISILDPVDKAEDGLEELAEDAVMAEATAEPDATSTESEAMAESDEDTPPSPVSNAPANNDEERFIEGRVRIRNVGDLERGGSTLFYLYQEGSRNILIILSDNSDTNADAFDLLLDRKLLECQATSQIAVCQTEDPNEDLPPSLRSNRIAKILIVSDDDGHEREDAQTGALEFSDAFSQTTYVTDIWTTSDDGDLDIDTLLEYDAIIWATGDYWDDSIGQEDVELLTEYVTVGGNLIMSGASIGFDWDHTDFLTSVAHADYLDFAQQTDMVVSQADHPIATDFDEDTVIEFLETPSGEELLSDVVNYTEDARVIFRRGPDSEADDAPVVIAYEDDRVKIAYYAFPLYLLPSTERTLLVNNTVDWFTKKVLDLPTARDYEPYETDGITRPAPSDEENQDEDTGGGDEAPADGDENGGEGDNEGEGDNQEGENGDEGNNDEGDNTEDQGEDGNNDQGDGGGDEGENNDGGTN